MGGSIGTPKSLNECDFNYGTSLYSKLCSPSYWRAVLFDPRLPKGEYPVYFIRNGFYCSLEISNGYCILDQNSTVHWTEPLKKSETDIRL